MPNFQAAPPTVTLSEAAATLGLHATTLSRWCRLGLVKEATLTATGWHMPRTVVATLDPLIHSAYTIKQVAKSWNISPRTVQRYISAGHLIANRLPAKKRGQLRITESALLAFESSTQPPAA